MKVYYHSPIGIIELRGGPGGLESCSLVRKSRPGVAAEKFKFKPPAGPEPVAAAWRQLDEYFRGTRQKFQLKLKPAGTGFQQQVWRQLQKIPYGQTRTYGQIAAACGRPKAARAVGQANHQNPLLIIVPCHRVIGVNGSLVGFGGGLWRKHWLLAHEKKISGQTQPEIKKAKFNKTK
ncbi:MAG: methylated-DNA--[protein]-cysteine S-methyltransferase [Candidatus Saccharicenans sp.]|nr:methylated-DNA--[protein]-cysteine S-methyltransferase [Candidatus Saccharicenans sp.]